MAGIGEKPGPTTNGCWKEGRLEEPVEAGHPGELEELVTWTEIRGGALNLIAIECEAIGITEVFTKEGTRKGHLPC